MLKRIFTIVCCFILSFSLLPLQNINASVAKASEVTDSQDTEDLPSLKETYKDYFLIGNIMEPNQIQIDAITSMFNYHYNLMSAENAMKPASLSPRKGVYNLSAADSLVQWAQDNGVLVHGHTLVWHSQSSRWLNRDAAGDPLTREEARANMEEYINNVAGHYKGKIFSWDVVNEAFHGASSIPADWRDALRKKSNDDSQTSYWYLAYENGADPSKGESGADYIYDAFVFTRLADPEAILYYNDFNENQPWKREAMALMAEDLNNQWKNDPRNTEPDRLLIEVLGMQSHYWTADFNISSVDATIARFIKAGVKVGITELDIPLGAHNGYLQNPTENDYLKQAMYYAQLFEVYKKYSDHIDRVTFWGKTDPQSWRSKGNPLLFDRTLAAKPAFHAVIDPESFLRPNSPDNEDNNIESTPEPTPTETPTSTPAPTSEPDTTKDPADTAASDNKLIPAVLISAGALLCIILIWIVVRRKKK